MNTVELHLILFKNNKFPALVLKLYYTGESTTDEITENLQMVTDQLWTKRRTWTTLKPFLNPQYLISDPTHFLGVWICFRWNFLPSPECAINQKSSHLYIKTNSLELWSIIVTAKLGDITDWLFFLICRTLISAMLDSTIYRQTSFIVSIVEAGSTK